ncbi:hypothetical protein [Limnospira indica]|nr:hypothetical protein [Limnospira indica]QNH59007.1 MAG: hypothetical protein H2674_07080 [Limnospira indica BM01]
MVPGAIALNRGCFQAVGNILTYPPDIPHISLYTPIGRSPIAANHNN